MTEEKKEELIKSGFEEEAIDAYIKLGIEADEGVEDFEEAHQGKWIDDEEFVEDLLRGTGDLPELPVYIYIDWERTARDVMMDYSEQDGYYFRNL